MKKKAILLLVLVLVGSMGLSGCLSPRKKKGAEPGTPGPSSQELIPAMISATAKKTLIETDWKTELTMTIPIVMEVIDSLTMQEIVAGQGTLLTDTGNMRSYNAGVIGLGMTGDDGMELEMYSEQSNTDSTHVISYVQADDVWMMNDTAFEATSFFAGIPAVERTDAYEETSISEYVDDLPCWKIKASLTPEEAEALFPQDLGVMAAGGPLSFQFMGEGPISAELYVEQHDALPVRLVMYSDQGEPNVDASAGYQLSGLNLTLDYTFPKRRKIKVPKKARNAETSYTGLADWYDIEEERQEALESTWAGNAFEQLENPQIIRDFVEEKTNSKLPVIWDKDKISIRMNRIYTDGEGAVYVDLAAANQSDFNLDLFSKGTALNGLMNNKENEDGFDMSLPAGEEKEISLRIPVPENLPISNISQISLWLTGSNSENYRSVFDTGVKVIPLAEKIVSEVPKAGGTVVFENESIRLSAYPGEQTENGIERLLCFENLCDQPVSVSSEWIKSGDNYLDGSIYAELFPQTICYTWVHMDGEALMKKGIEKLGSLSFRLSGVSFQEQHYKALFETDEIRIP